MQAELQIFKELQLKPSKAVLPYDPNSIKPMRLQFYATGGDSNYVWFSGNPQVLHVDVHGLTTTEIRDVHPPFVSQELLEGGNTLAAHTTVKVALAKNPKISRLAKIFFLPPKRLQIKRYNFETALKDYVYLHVAVYSRVNNSDVPYTRCDNLNFQLELSHHILQQESSDELVEPAQDACHVLRLRATAIGSSSVRVWYSFQDKVLDDSVDLYVFEPMSILNPNENEVVLPVGSSRNIIFAHGPQRIFTLEAELTKAKSFDSKIVKVSEIELSTQNEISAFTVLCRELGETDFSYRVHNSLSKPSFVAYRSVLTIRVHCVPPRFLKLHARQQLRESCPLEQSSSLLYLKDRENKFEIEIEVQDVENRKLMNISSLWLNWEFGAGEERYPDHKISHRQIAELEVQHGVSLPSRDVLILTLIEVAANFRIKGTVAHYNDQLLSQQGISAEHPAFGVHNVRYMIFL